MGISFIGEIRMFAGNFPPNGWAFCDGQLIPISENDALFTLIGTIYGGDGETTFALPDLRGRFPIHHGQGSGLSARTIGRSGGTEEETLTVQQIPAHTHTLLASTEPARRSRRRRRDRRRRQRQHLPAHPPAATPMDVAAVSPAAASRTTTCTLHRHPLHHLAVRAVPEFQLRDDGAGSLSPKSASNPSTSRRPAGRSATASCCRCRRTPPCSRCSARSMAATAPRPSAFPTCRARRRFIGPGPRPLRTLRRRDERQRDRPCSSRKCRTHLMSRAAPSTRAPAIPRPMRWSPAASAATPTRPPRSAVRADVVPGAHARGRPCRTPISCPIWCSNISSPCRGLPAAAVTDREVRAMDRTAHPTRNVLIGVAGAAVAAVVATPLLWPGKRGHAPAARRQPLHPALPVARRRRTSRVGGAGRLRLHRRGRLPAAAGGRAADALARRPAPDVARGVLCGFVLDGMTMPAELIYHIRHREYGRLPIYLNASENPRRMLAVFN